MIKFKVNPSLPKFTSVYLSFLQLTQVDQSWPRSTQVNPSYPKLCQVDPNLFKSTQITRAYLRLPWSNCKITLIYPKMSLRLPQDYPWDHHKTTIRIPWEYPKITLRFPRDYPYITPTSPQHYPKILVLLAQNGFEVRDQIKKGADPHITLEGGGGGGGA